MQQQPTISALVSTYNSQKLIESRIHNLLTQQDDTLSVEIIIIDSGSNESEESVVRPLQKLHPNIKYIRTEQETLYAAWNRGVEIATGKYITNANTDDRLFHGAFARLTKHLDNHPQIGLTYADVFQSTDIDDIIAFDGRTISPTWKVITRPDYSHKELLIGCLCGQQPVWRRQLHERLGVFDSNYVVAGDYEFWLRLAEDVDFYHIAEPLGLVFKNIRGLEWRNQDKLNEENLRIRSKYFREPHASKSGR